MAAEMEERRLDLAERNIYEALKSDDSRRRDAASFFVVRNSHRARKRGWITTSTSAAQLRVRANAGRVEYVFRWRTPEDDKKDAEQAEIERQRDEGKRVISIGWDDDGKPIEHEAKPNRPDKD